MATLGSCRGSRFVVRDALPESSLRSLPARTSRPSVPDWHNFHSRRDIGQPASLTEPPLFPWSPPTRPQFLRVGAVAVGITYGAVNSVFHGLVRLGLPSNDRRSLSRFSPLLAVVPTPLFFRSTHSGSLVEGVPNDTRNRVSLFPRPALCCSPWLTGSFSLGVSLVVTSCSSRGEPAVRGSLKGGARGRRGRAAGSEDILSSPVKMFWRRRFQ